MTFNPTIAVLIPCRDEALTIGKVVAEFRRALPQAAIWVCDNRSRDDTATRAREAGARVISESRPGKGHAVRALFTVADADQLILVDGDDTYDAGSARGMLKALADDDVFSGYRAFTRRFVRSFPALSRRFEIETELTVHALDLGLRIREIDAPYGARADGSASKLNTLRDGARIAFAILHLYEQTHPARFFGAVGAVLALAGLAVGVPVILDYAETGLVPRLPSAVLAAALMMLAAGSIACGVVLDSVGRGRREMKRLAFLALDAPRHDAMAAAASLPSTAAMR
jgi:Glycosyl transferase family 2